MRDTIELAALVIGVGLLASPNWIGILIGMGIVAYTGFSITRQHANLS